MCFAWWQKPIILHHLHLSGFLGCGSAFAVVDRHTRGQIHWLFCFALLHPKTNVPKMKGVTKCCSREGRVVPWLLPTPLSFPGSYKRRKRKSIIVTVMLLIVSILILVFGLAATTRTQNITVGGYYPGVIVSMLLMFIVVRRTDCELSS